MRRWLAACLVAASAAACGDGGADPGGRADEARPTVRVGPADNRATVTVDAGGRLVVDLTSPEEHGMWSLARYPRAVVEPTTPTRDARTFRFTARAPGRGLLIALDSSVRRPQGCVDRMAPDATSPCAGAFKKALPGPKVFVLTVVVD